MDVPSPSVATAIADDLAALADAVAAAEDGLDTTRGLLALQWHGHAATAAGAVLEALDRHSAETGLVLRQASQSWHGLAHRLRVVQQLAEAADVASAVCNALAVSSLLQAGLDLADDAAAAAAKAAEEGALRAALAALAAVLEEVVVRTAEARAALLSLRTAVLYVGRSVGLQVAASAAADGYLRGRVTWSDVVSPSVAIGLVPDSGALSAFQGLDFDPAVRTHVPAAFGSRDRYELAVRRADSWAAESTDHALVSVTAEGGGVRLTVVGGGVVDRGVRPGEVYDAATLPPGVADLRELLDEIAVYAHGPVTVVGR